MSVYVTNSEAETRALASRLADVSKSGDVFLMKGDLGAGKTAFAKGYAEGLGVREDVTSPTFTLIHEYQGRLPFYHFDLYRLNDADSLYEIGFDEYLDRQGVCMIEWADQLAEEMPEEGIWISIERVAEAGCDVRRITIDDHGAMTL